MLKPEQIPDEVINAYMHMIVFGGVDGAEAIAAAINAWPGMLAPYAGTEFAERIILPLNTEPRDD